MLTVPASSSSWGVNKIKLPKSEINYELWFIKKLPPIYQSFLLFAKFNTEEEEVEQQHPRVEEQMESSFPLCSSFPSTFDRESALSLSLNLLYDNLLPKTCPPNYIIIHAVHVQSLCPFFVTLYCCQHTDIVITIIGWCLNPFSLKINSDSQLREKENRGTTGGHSGSGFEGEVTQHRESFRTSCCVSGIISLFITFIITTRQVVNIFNNYRRRGRNVAGAGRQIAEIRVKMKRSSFCQAHMWYMRASRGVGGKTD